MYSIWQHEDAPPPPLRKIRSVLPERQEHDKINMTRTAQSIV